MAAGRISSIRTYQVAMPNAGQEYSFTVPAGSFGIRLQPQGATDIWLALEVGKTQEDFWTVRQAPARYFELADVTFILPVVLYFSSPSPGAILEVMVLR